ncbi:MAG: hypothetical protein R2874_06255 [Desulfobacterales bacterium]
MICISGDDCHGIVYLFFQKRKPAVNPDVFDADKRREPENNIKFGQRPIRVRDIDRCE